MYVCLYVCNTFVCYRWGVLLSTVGLGDTGRMLSSAFSDSFLPTVGIEDGVHPSEFSPQPPMPMDEQRR